VYDWDWTLLDTRRASVVQKWTVGRVKSATVCTFRGICAHICMVFDIEVSGFCIQLGVMRTKTLLIYEKEG
jgi:hypothetical protein